MYMKNLFQDAFNESLDRESNAGIMHLKDVEAKKAGKDSFKLGDKTFPVKEKKKVLDKEGAGVMHFKDQKAKEAGKDTFELGGKEFPVKESDKKWIQKTSVSKHKGDLHKALHVSQGEKIPADKLNKAVHSKNPHTRHMAQFAKNVQKEESEHMTPSEIKKRNDIYKNLPKKDIEKRYGKDIRGNIATAKALAENAYGAALGMEAKPAHPPAAKPAPTAEPSDDERSQAAWNKSLSPETDPAAFDAAANPSLKLDTEGVAKAREWIKKLDDMATFINGADENSLNAQINALEMRNSIPFKGIVRREEKRITKLAENLRGLAELFKTVVTSSGKKIHDATSKITTR